MAASEGDLKRVRTCRNQVIRNAVLVALRSGIRYRMMGHGIMLYGENGVSTTIHFTHSDHRADKNALARLRSIGVDLPKKGK